MTTPKVGNIFRLAQIIQESCEQCTDQEATSLAKAILEHPGSRWCPQQTPVPEGEDELFDLWWFNEGSGMAPLPEEDQEEHVHRISRIAWQNGAYTSSVVKDFFGIGEALKRVREFIQYAIDLHVNREKRDLENIAARIENARNFTKLQLETARASIEQEEPTDDDLKNAVREALKDYKYSTEIPYFLDGTEEEPMMIALRAVCSLGRHALPLPTEDDMNDLADEILGIVLPEGSGARLIRRALELWGRPAIEPVPVSEHLPGPEDCDSEGMCWYFHINEDGVVAWIKQRPTRISRCPIYRLSHWLPHWALPVPSSTTP